MSQRAPVLVAGKWLQSSGSKCFSATNPNTLQSLEPSYPISDWQEVDRVLSAAYEAFLQLQRIPFERIAEFLETYAQRIEEHSAALVDLAHQETGLPVKPRLADVELPRTTGQLRRAADAAREGSWAMATIDTQANIRSCYQAIGPVAVFGPNNFPFAFGSVSGGDFAAAIAAGNPVIGKANTSHPGTTRLFAELALQAVQASGLPESTVQLIYRVDHQDGARMVADHRLGAIGYTGSRKAGLTLKAAADAVGKPIYLELSSVNPVVMLPGALQDRGADLATEFVGSVLMGTGQFCTNPGLIITIAGEATEAFIEAVRTKFEQTAPGVLLSPSVQKSLTSAIDILTQAGAELLCGGKEIAGRCSVSNTLLRVSAQQFIAAPETFQTEAFGNASLIVVAQDVAQAVQVVEALEGNLTGCIYSDRHGSDDAIYEQLSTPLGLRVGRLLNDKMPTGVAVSPAMNHGGPFPATGHPGFTAVGIPASMLRFGKLTCYDNVRPERLPHLLRNANPTGKTWRLIDLNWSTANV